MTTKNQKENKNEQGFWDDAKENINEGARIVGEEARDLGEKISSYSEKIFGEIKDRTTDLFQSGKELTMEAVNKAQEIAEKYRDRTEIAKLNEEKKRVAAQLGMSFYLILKNNDNKVPPTLLRRKDIKTTLKQMEELDQQILDLSDDK
jgi:hypothetical protein